MVKDPTLLPSAAARSDGESAQPLWILRVLHMAKLLGLHPDDVTSNTVVTAAYVGLTGSAFALTVQCARLGGYSPLCSVRATLFALVSCAGAVIDWCALISCNRWQVAEFPIVWSPQQRDDLAVLALSRSLKDIPFRTVVWMVGNIIPLSLWACRLGGEGSLVYMVIAALLMAPVVVLHLLFDALTFSFFVAHSREAQRDFRERLLVRKEFSLDAALRALATINARRRMLQSLFANFLPCIFFSWWMGQTILVHDSVLRPWGGWPMTLLYMMNAISIIGIMRPYLEANDWTDMLAQEVIESTHLGWSTHERADFVTLLKASKVEFTVAGYAMRDSFGTSICVAMFALWLYVYEAQAFNGWPGFSFDLECGVEVHI